MNNPGISPAFPVYARPWGDGPLVGRISGVADAPTSARTTKIRIIAESYLPVNSPLDKDTPVGWRFFGLRGKGADALRIDIGL